MRHGAAANLTSNDALLKIVHADVGPHISGQVNKYGVNAFQTVKKSCQIIIMLYLGGWVTALQAQVFAHKFIPEFVPVKIRIGNGVGIKVACGTPKLGRVGYVAQLAHLLVKAFYKNHDFFTQARG